MASVTGPWIRCRICSLHQHSYLWTWVVHALELGSPWFHEEVCSFFRKLTLLTCSSEIGYTASCTSCPQTGRGTVWSCRIVDFLTGSRCGWSTWSPRRTGYQTWVFHSGDMRTMLALCLFTCDSTFGIIAHGGLDNNVTRLSERLGECDSKYWN